MTNKTADEILADMAADRCCEHGINNPTKATNEAKAQFLAAELERIGEDEELGSRPPALDGAAWEEYTIKEHRNELRAELRATAKEYWK